MCNFLFWDTSLSYRNSYQNIGSTVASLLSALSTVVQFSKLLEQLSSMASTMVSLLSAVPIVEHFTKLPEILSIVTSTVASLQNKLSTVGHFTKLLEQLSFMSYTLHKIIRTTIKYVVCSCSLTKSSSYCRLLH
jgi:hypothetical protein